jgi:hypothetical protein
MRHGLVVAIASLLMVGCGDAKQQAANADIPFDTRGGPASGPVGRSEITAIDAALGDSAEMPAESDMVAPSAPAATAPGNGAPAPTPVVEPPPVLPAAPIATSGS